MTSRWDDERAGIGFARQPARRLVGKCGIRHPPVDLQAAVKHLGLEYHEVELTANVSACCCEYEGRRYALVNRSEHPHHQRFSLPHGIGHAELLHTARYVLVEQVDIDRPPQLIRRFGASDP